jgi:hypothetical protein
MEGNVREPAKADISECTPSANHTADKIDLFIKPCLDTDAFHLELCNEALMHFNSLAPSLKRFEKDCSAVQHASDVRRTASDIRELVNTFSNELRPKTALLKEQSLGLGSIMDSNEKWYLAPRLTGQYRVPI